ncbi:MAG: hypothetical protein QOJ16_1016 [Acidobacteriota bacterium]|jgi:hypothetical protein|nr:hypothetical protein [Acidobacteriota bacterium]
MSFSESGMNTSESKRFISGSKSLIPVSGKLFSAFKMSFLAS